MKASKFLDSLTEFLGNSDDMTNEELKEALREEGIDPDKLVERCQALKNEGER